MKKGKKPIKKATPLSDRLVRIGGIAIISIMAILFISLIAFFCTSDVGKKPTVEKSSSTFYMEAESFDPNIKSQKELIERIEKSKRDKVFETLKND